MGKKLIQINTVCNESTGHIMRQIQICVEKEGFQTISVVGRRKTYQDFKCVKFGSVFSFWLHVIINTLFDKQGYGSYFPTKKLVTFLKKENPDVIHLHNIHGYYLHLPTLMKYLNDEYRGEIFWTFHDCWPFTGHCPHFVCSGCDKWQKECGSCPSVRQYPISLFFDSSRSNYTKKKKWFTSLNRMTILVPSYWMKDLVKKSFMKDYPVNVIANGVDVHVFKRCFDENIRKRYGIPEGKKILLGVASVWSEKKGLTDFVMLSRVISTEYCIVLVGVKKSLKRKLSGNIICIQRTEDKKELAALYSEAHIFINPSQEESFSLVTVEAMACGTPVIVLDTSAVQELVTGRTGVVLHSHRPEDFVGAVKKIEGLKLNSKEIRMHAEKYSVETFEKRIAEIYKRN